ncbi:MAG: vWA domain-containing protein [Gaiellaceae bacterium]
MAASISPTSAGSTNPYTITASKGAIADLSLDFGTNNPSSLITTYPTGTAATIVVTGPSSTPHDVSAVADGTTIVDGNREIVVSKASAAGTDTVQCDITATSGAAVDTWHVKISAPAETNWTFQQPDGGVTRLMCDPVSGITLSSLDPPAPTIGPPATVREKQKITMTGLNPVSAATVVGSPSPTVYCRWRVESAPPMVDFPDCGTVSGAPTKSVIMPGVYADTPFTLVQEVWFDAACPAPTDPPPGFLNAKTSAAVTIKTAPQRVMLVLDRSGSMSGDRWNNAVAGAQILIDLIAAVRGVPPGNTGDKVGVRIFEDPNCSWGTKAPLPVNGNIGLSKPADAATLDDGPPPHDFGAPGSCTPIGDGLLAAIDDLLVLGTADYPHFTIILLTDGYENSGATKVDPEITNAVSMTYDTAKTMNGRSDVTSRMTLYAIGLGTWVQDSTLNQLPWPAYPFPSPPVLQYRNVTDVHELANAIGQMASFAMEARASGALAGDSTPADPSPPGTPGISSRYFSTETGVRILAVAVLWPDDVNPKSMTLSYRAHETAAGFTDSGATPKKFPTHGFISVDLTTLPAGAKDWRVEWYEGTAVIQTLDDAHLLIYKDLDTLADARFDKLVYRTGDQMHVEVRARTGAEVVSGLEVVVELARPGQSLGTYLVENGTGWQPGQPQGPDPLPDKASMLQYATRRGEGKANLSILTPSGFFVDGTNQLWEDTTPAGAGNYLNTYANVDVEGTYTLRFYVHGTLADGSDFTQVMTHSVWCGILPDPGSSAVGTATLGANQLQVSVTPRDALGQYLGPFRTTWIDFQTTSGTWAGPVVDHYDGSYSRVLQLEKGIAPTITPVVDGVPLHGTIVTTGWLGKLIAWLQRLCKKIIRLLLALFGKTVKP